MRRLRISEIRAQIQRIIEYNIDPNWSEEETEIYIG